MRCKTCDGTGVVNEFPGPDNGSNSFENWPGPCPDCCPASNFLSNREAHEEAAGMAIDKLFFEFNKIDPNGASEIHRCTST